ncbi:heavy metal translocating P-type ATPase [Iodobacter fluviatilis]|uniref:P-type Zn(2+) transporter n=2 Tax=Iodobacter fluviatilis TaxID=537 RepID=A0A377Q6Y5_9NEIS|nr:heavy metal translocating P-type ATPase [Iodobacter fluviatilis]TCU88881.1 Cd2+/Zn2+-exporting ATPase [Iodobacter fluviatilis]STQ91046.1 Probable cadmium-transporting ATPase [Iodobacter fluviatilis]
MSSCCNHSSPAKPRYRIVGSPPPPLPQGDGAGVLSKIHIQQMDCPTEEGLIRKKLGAMADVSGLQFNLLQRVLTVSHRQEALPAILAAIRDLGFTPRLDDASKAVVAEVAKPWWPLALAGVLAVGAEVCDWLAMPVWLTAVLAVAAVLTCGLTTYKKGWIAVSNGDLNINALMSIAVTGALLIGQCPEAAMVMVLFTLAELIEAKSLGRARNAISGLLQLTPERATVQQADGSWQEQAAADIALGSVLRVRPGERIALDGELIAGQSFINQAAITGESLVVEKNVGDTVFASTINETGSFEYRVTAVAGNTMLARIIHAVEAAQGVRAPTQRFVDRFSKIYTPLVCALALAVAVFPPLLMGGAWQEWLYRALAMLVIACPCALVISTPVTIVSGLARAARQGILIKGGVYLEEGRKLKSLALDKTGTLTFGKPVQTDVVALADVPLEVCQRIASSLGGRSDHPVSKAIAVQSNDYLEVSDVKALLGRGISGQMDGISYAMGNHRLIEELGLCSPALEEKLQALEMQGKSVVVLASNRVLALFAVADTVRPSSREAIAQLQALGVTTVVLSGDNEHTVAAIARDLGIAQAHGNLLPEDKLRLVEGMVASSGMVGDGINDAPALARADIGFAMGAAGTDTAIETADVALMDDDLRKIPEFIRLSQATHRILVQNIALALLVKALFLALTLAGHGTLWMAVFADMGVSLLVVLNGLRLLRE